MRKPSQHLTSLSDLEQAAECLRVLAHPHRLRMIQMLLRGQYTVGELAEACELPSAMASEHLRLMQRCGFTAKGFFVMDGSRRSAHANAYFTGLGAAKRVVFFDTLLSKLSVEEVEAGHPPTRLHHRRRGGGAYQRAERGHGRLFGSGRAQGMPAGHRFRKHPRRNRLDGAGTRT